MTKTKPNPPTIAELEARLQRNADAQAQARQDYDATAYDAAVRSGDDKARAALMEADRRLQTLDAERRALDSVLREAKAREATKTQETRYERAAEAHASLPEQLTAFETACRGFDAQVDALAERWADVAKAQQSIADAMGPLLAAKEREPGDYIGGSGANVVPLLQRLPALIAQPGPCRLLSDAAEGVASSLPGRAENMLASARRALTLKQQAVRDGAAPRADIADEQVRWSESLRRARLRDAA